MSTLSVGTIKSITSATPPTIQDSGGTETGKFSRAWINFDGSTSTPTVNSSFNVTGITDNGTGSYNVNFTNAMTDTFYVTVVSCGAGAASLVAGGTNNITATSSSSVQITTVTSAGTLTDATRVAVAVFR